MLTPLSVYKSPFSVAKCWPTAMPLLCLAGSGRFAMLVVAAYEISAAEALDRPLFHPRSPVAARRWPFTSGVLGLLTYEHFTAFACQQPSRFFQVTATLLFDQEQRQLWLSDDGIDGREEFRLSPAELSAVINAPLVASPALAELHLRPQEADPAYLEKVATALADIRNGRYYQINLLRYFSLSRDLERAEILQRLEQRAGPYAAYFELPGLHLASFSPERFITVQPQMQAAKVTLQVTTAPIKGTARRPRDPERDHVLDAALAQALGQSLKDLAELHMIVDLLRNDLNRISNTGSVEVRDSGRVVSYPTVHHLQACIAAELPLDLRLIDLLSAVCPAGSITGAPKKEVIGAIRTYEGRSRGYFMGHIFYLDKSGRFDSSILIRTLVDSQGQAEFAAGSGLVMHSDAQQERREIDTKCQVLL